MRGRKINTSWWKLQLVPFMYARISSIQVDEVRILLNCCGSIYNNMIRWLKLHLVTIFFSGDFLVLLSLHLLPWFHTSINTPRKTDVLWSKLVTKAKNVLSSVRENSMNKWKSLRSWKASFSIFYSFNDLFSVLAEFVRNSKTITSTKADTKDEKTAWNGHHWKKP